MFKKSLKRVTATLLNDKIATIKLISIVTGVCPIIQKRHHMKKLTILLISSLLLIFTSLVQAVPNARIVGGDESASDNWKFMSALMLRHTELNVQDQSFSSFYIVGSAPQLFTGALVSCGKAFTICHDAKDNICLIERGETFFFEKIQNCEAGGGIGAIVYNNVEGHFGGTLGDYIASIPAVSISRQSGLNLLSYLNEPITLNHVSETPFESFCGATYIGDKWAITAAHCVDHVSSQALVLNIGGHDLETDHENIVDVVNIYVHAAYNEETIENDIALLELATIPENVSTIDIPDLEILKTAIDENATTTALGRGVQEVLDPTDPGLDAEGVSVLFQLEINLVSNAECNLALNKFAGNGASRLTLYITDDMVCAGVLEEGEGVCFGDSGGPLILQQNSKNYLIGVVSWVPGCAQQGVYDVYSNVPFFKNDIESFISGKTASFGRLGGGDRAWYAQLNLWFLLLFSVIVIGFRIRHRHSG